MTDTKESKEKLNDAFERLERLLDNAVRQPDNSELEILRRTNAELQEKLFNQNNSMTALENKNKEALNEVEKLIDKIRKL